MRDVWITRRADGVTELSPRLGALDLGERWLVIVTALIAAAGFFMAGVVPAEIFVTLVVACLAGELVLGVKEVFLFLLRPPAQVYEVPRFGRRR